VPPLSQLTSCTPTKYNLCLANSLAAAISEPALYRLLTFQVPNLSPSRCLGRTKVSVQVWGFVCEYFVTKIRFHGEELVAPLPSTRWRATPCRLSATAYSIYSQLPSILEDVPPSATWGRAMPWWHKPTYHIEYSLIINRNVSYVTKGISCCPALPWEACVQPIHVFSASRNGVFGVASRYGLDGPWIESRLGARFSAPV
jgi:hypothetical protein